MAKLSKQAQAIQKARTAQPTTMFDAVVRNRQAKGVSGSLTDKLYRASIVRGFAQSNLKNASAGKKVVGGRLVNK